MTAIAVILILALFVVPVIVATRKGTSSTNRLAWVAAAQRLGFSDKTARKRRPRALKGELDGFVVDIDTFERGAGNSSKTYSYIRVEGRGRIPNTIQLSGETGWQAVKKIFSGDDIQTGDSDFDALVHVKGVEIDARATLDHDARLAVTKLVQRGGEIRAGDVYFEQRGVFDDPQLIVTLSQLMVSTAAALAKKNASGPSALVSLVRQDPSIGVRHANLTALTEHFAQHPACREAAQLALHDVDPGVRLLAAKTLGDEGRATLESIVLGSRLPPELRASALDALAALDDVATLTARTAEMLASEHEVLRLAALRAAERVRSEALLDPVSRLVATGTPDEQAGAARALGAMGDVRAEVPLLNLLETGNVAAQTAAANALARLGTARSVEPLLLYTKGMMVDAELKKAAREAVQAIQASLSGAEAGRLSLAEPRADVGGLTLAGPETVQDSRTEHERPLHNPRQERTRTGHED